MIVVIISMHFYTQTYKAFTRPLWNAVNPFAPKLKKCILPNLKKQLYERRSENLYSIITFHLSKLCKVKFSILRECHISCEVAGEF